MRAAINIFSVLIIAVLLRYARDAAAWSPLSTIAESVEYQPLVLQYRVSAPEVLRVVSKASHQLRAEAIDDASQPFARLRSLSTGDAQFYVVFSTPTDNAARAAFATFTQRPLLSLVGDRAYIAVGSDAWASAARAFPGVLSVLRRSPVGKLSPHLKSMVDKQPRSRLKIISHCFPGTGCASAARNITESSLACEIYTHFDTLELHCDATDARAACGALAEAPGVHWLQLKTSIKARNFAGSSIMATGASQTAPTIPSHVFSAITLQPTSIIAVADSGLDRNNCFFCTSASQCHNDTATPSGRNVHRYWFMSSSECARCGRCGNKNAGTHAAQACGNNVDQDGHGTHVAGTIAGKSITATAPATDLLNGIAAGASLFFQDIHNGVSNVACKNAGLGEGCGEGLYPPTDLYHLFKPALDAGARIHSNSWGCASDEEYPFSCNVYSSNARQIDDFVHTNQDFIVVVAAGNDGLLAEGYTVGDPATCKNCLSVGATQLNADQVQANAEYVHPNTICEEMEAPPSCCNRNPQTCTRKDCCDAAQAAGHCAACCNTACSLPSSQSKARPSANNLADFSSRGPTFDSRFKPDIVAPGEHITSACAGVSAATSAQAAQAAGTANHCNASWASTTECAVTLMSGTSMATPLVAGALEYIRQYFLRGYFPSLSPTPLHQLSVVPESLVRATIIAGARQITGTVRNSDNDNEPLPVWYPNYPAGFGRPMLDRSLPIGSSASNVGLAVALNNKALYTLSAAIPTRAFTFRCASLLDSSVHVVLVWSDPPGNPAALKQIVNDLDLIVYVGTGSKVYGNTLSYADTANTVEKVVVQCSSSSTVTAIVTAANTLSTSSQTFSLVANGNVITQLAQVLSNIPSFPPGRPAPIATTSQQCGSPSDLVNEFPEISIAALMKFKNSGFRFPRAQVAYSDLISQFTGSLSMFLGVPDYSVFVKEFSAGPWIGFSCGSYVCGSSGAAAPCYLAGEAMMAALKSRTTFLSTLPAAHPLSIIDWGDFATAETIDDFPWEEENEESGGGVLSAGRGALFAAFSFAAVACCA